MIGDGLEESLVGGLEMVGVGLKRNRVGDKFSEVFVAGGEMLHGLLEVEGRDASSFSGFFEHVVREIGYWKEGKRESQGRVRI